MNHSAMTNNPLLLIGQLAKEAGVKSDTIRFYEKQGLLPEPARSAAGYRIYDESALKRMRFIKRAQSLGFSLEEIKRIMEMRGSGGETCRCVIGIAESTLAELTKKLREMQAFHDRLEHALQGWKKNAARRRKCPAEFCDLIEMSFDEASLWSDEPAAKQRARFEREYTAPIPKVGSGGRRPPGS